MIAASPMQNSNEEASHIDIHKERRNTASRPGSAVLSNYDRLDTTRAYAINRKIKFRGNLLRPEGEDPRFLNSEAPDDDISE